MSATARLVETAVPTNEKPDEVLIHVRFMPSGDVIAIDLLPEKMKPNAWHGALLAAAPQHYQTLAGGRGFYRIPRATYQKILTETVQLGSA